MEVWGNDTGPELAKLSEQIFACKEEQKKLELLMSEENFRYQYILKRRGLLGHELLLVSALLVGIGLFITFTINTFMVFFDLLIVLLWFYLLFREANLIRMMIFSMDAPWAAAYAEKHDLNTFQRQETESSQKIAAYSVQLEKVKMKRSVLILKRKDLLNKKQAGKEDEEASSTGFKLKKSVAYEEERVLYDFYEREENFLLEQCSDCEIEIRNVEKEIREIDLAFEKVKKTLFVFLSAFILLAVIQGAMHGKEANYYGAFCLVSQFGLIFYLVKTCRKPIILYLVEHESDLIKDYAFVHGLFPVSKRLGDKKERYDELQKELQEIRGLKMQVL